MLHKHTDDYRPLGLPSCLENLSQQFFIFFYFYIVPSMEPGGTPKAHSILFGFQVLFLTHSANRMQIVYVLINTLCVYFF